MVGRELNNAGPPEKHNQRSSEPPALQKRRKI